MFKSSNEPVLASLEQYPQAVALMTQFEIGNTVIFNISVGYLVSVLFWLLVVVAPHSRRRAILRNNLLMHYSDFKRDLAHTMLDAAGDRDSYEKSFELTDFRKFREYFSESERHRWHAALNAIQSDASYLTDVHVEMDLLSDEFRYVLNNIEISDQELIAFIKRLLNYVYRLKHSPTFTGDEVKYLGGFIWEIMASWSTIDGQRDFDLIERMIRRI
ncbi:hypothetical protein [Halomonas sp. JS92-SW72]|uniref:hypothetical protein n=1 Tax=Halomonas sp. JS92-SW72 TaxID=2306583 RepID=UPI000E5B6172|nr:hypothetical protein [Halomonas sp. JS92-SW72]AXY42575.1 hypothetical protein D1793_10365 [Halomonas sp. JS92-SW72]